MDIKEKITDYLSLKKLKVGRGSVCICPKCGRRSAHIRPSVDFSIFCAICGDIGNIFSIVRLEKDKKDWNDEKIENYLKDCLNLDYLTEHEKETLLKNYKDLGWDLVRIAKNSKIPIQKEWTSREDKNINDWKTWLDENSNIGVKCGEKSGITVIDVDFLNNSEKKELRSGKIAEERKKELLNKRKERVLKFNKELIDMFPSTLMQESLGGFHFFYKYNSDLRKTSIDLDYCHLDIENDGGYILLYPSKVDGDSREIIKKPIVEMPNGLKEFIKKNSKFRKITKPTENKKLGNDFKTPLVGEGNRHNIIMHMGGLFRSRLNKQDTKFVLEVINNRLFSPPLSKSELYRDLDSLDKYADFDNEELISKVLGYIRMLGEGTARDVRDALKIDKEQVDTILSQLVREEYLLKRKRTYKALKKVEWKEEFADESKKIDYKMPYFYDSAFFRDGDMLVIGGRSGTGKSHISMCIVKQLVEQGKKPNYLNLEPGNRFATIAQTIGLKEGDFKYNTDSSPDEIELEDNAITIIDWLLPKDYAQTDKLYQYFAYQLLKHGGNLIIFAQLRSDGSFYAPDMVEFFPAFVAKYLYNDDSDGTKGHFKIEKRREALKSAKNKRIIPCTYLWDTKLLIRDDELKQGGL